MRHALEAGGLADVMAVQGAALTAVPVLRDIDAMVRGAQPMSEGR